MKLSFDEILKNIFVHIFNPLVLFMIGIAVLVFLWGIFEFLANYDEDSAQEQGKRHMFWGLVGMFVMFSVFGIMRFMIGTFGLVSPTGKDIVLPQAIVK